MKKGVFMKVEFSLYRGKILLQTEIEECNDYSIPFNMRLQNCLEKFCRKCDADLPIWMSNNTKELAAFHLTTFSEEHFLRKPFFDRLVLKFLGD